MITVGKQRVRTLSGDEPSILAVLFHQQVRCAPNVDLVH